MKEIERTNESETMITDRPTDIQRMLACNLRGDWVQVASYVGRYHGGAGNERGDIPIKIAEITREENNGEASLIGWLVAETPNETAAFHSIWTTEAAAREAAEALAVELDETPSTDDVIAEIETTGYFEDNDIIPLIVEAATQYSEGYLLITPDIGQPVGERWTTNGYLQCPHLRIDATHGTEAKAAEALLNAIKSQRSDDE